MPNFLPLIATNASRWSAMRIVAAHIPILDSVAARLVVTTAKSLYQALEGQTGVPWYVIAVIHEREASQSWHAQLGQGDPLTQRSIHFPAGRIPYPAQPPFTWSACAYDALANCAPFAAQWKDWSIGGLLTLLERYNGLGYFYMNKPSPYIWSKSDQYIRGKYVSDRHYDPNAVDTQMGCAPLLVRMMLLDQSITFSIAPRIDVVPFVALATPIVLEAPVVHDTSVHIAASQAPASAFSEPLVAAGESA